MAERDAGLTDAQIDAAWKKAQRDTGADGQWQLSPALIAFARALLSTPPQEAGEQEPAEVQEIEAAIDRIEQVINQRREPGWSYRNTITTNRTVIREQCAKLRARLASLAQPTPVPPTLPKPGSAEASAMIDTLLAEYQYPANSKNAARAGYEAARRMLAALAAPAQAVQPNPRALIPQSAHDWLTSSEPHGAASREWMEGWDACRNRVASLAASPVSTQETRNRTPAELSAAWDAGWDALEPAAATQETQEGEPLCGNTPYDEGPFTIAHPTESVGTKGNQHE